MSSKHVLIAGAAMTLAGCSTVNKNIGQEDVAFGEAVKYNAAAQVINPDPVYAENGAKPGDSGTQGASAVKRYRTDAVNARHKAEASSAKAGALSTTQSTSSGSGGPK
jgi:type IV pilus biogenesis protein CpaD/CtpE